MRNEIDRLEGDERRRAAEEFAQDPLAREPTGGLGQVRLAFGPFLALGGIELLLFGDIIEAEVLWVLRGY
jgi:hypothetical protein